MGINFGTATPSDYKLGENAVSAIYFGSTQVWPEGTPPPAADSYLGYVTLLLHADGTGSSFVDSSPYPDTLAASGVTHSATNGRASWGNSSAYFNGSGHRLTTADRPEFWLSNLDYVVEAWLYIPTLNTQGGGNFFSQAMNVGNNANRQFSFAANSSGLQLYWTTDGIGDNVQLFSTSLPVGQWFHVAFVRSSNTLRGYVNAAQVGSTVSHTATYYNSTANVCIGSFGQYASNGLGYLDFAGYIDDLRVTRGSDRGYPSGFTVPTAAFPDTGTLLPTKIAITRTNGDSTITGAGTFITPFYRASQLSVDNTDGVSRYKFTATSTGTLFIRFDFYDNDDGGHNAIILKRVSESAADTTFATSYGFSLISIPIDAGNVVSLSASNPSVCDFANVIVYTT